MIETKNTCFQLPGQNNIEVQLLGTKPFSEVIAINTVLIFVVSAITCKRNNVLGLSENGLILAEWLVGDLMTCDLYYKHQSQLKYNRVWTSIKIKLP